MASIWISRIDLEDLIGQDAALALLTAFPGRSVYVTRKWNLDKLVPIIGPVAAEILRAEFGGCEIVLPTGAIKPPTLKDQIAPMIEQGLSHNEIAQQLGCSWRYVAMVKADMGLTKPQATQKPRSEVKGNA